MFDSAGAAAQAFAADYKAKAGTSPSWVAGYAGTVLVIIVVLYRRYAV